MIRASLLDRVGLHFFTLYASLNGVVTGVLTLAMVILTKALGASEIEVGAMASLSVVALLLGIFGSGFAEGRDKRPYILAIGTLRGAVFLGFIFCTKAWVFVAIFGVFYVFNALLMPAVFAMWQANISSEARSRLWGLTVTIATLLSMAAAYLAGKVLDWQPFSYRWMLPVVGIIALLSITVLSLSPLRGKHKLSPSLARAPTSELITAPIKRFVALLQQDRRFFRFEMAFFLYGLALMLTFPVVPLYIVDVGKMSYEQAGIACGILGQIGVVFLSPWWGRLMDRTSPPFVCALVITILALFPALLLSGLLLPPEWTTNIVYVAHFFFGIGMSGIHVAWSVGPLFFAGKRDASNYSGAHVTLTGIRGLLGPMLGSIGLRFLGYAPVFCVSIILFLLAALGMSYLLRHDKLLELKDA